METLDDIKMFEEDRAEGILTPEVKTLVQGEGYHITKEVQALKVSNKTDYERACELGTANKRVLNQIEQFRKLIVKPLNDQIKNINKMFKTIAGRFQGNDEKIRKELSSYQNKVKRDSIQNVETETGRATIQEKWCYEVLNPDAVPREWCNPDEARIGKAVRSGLLRDLSGVRIFKKKVTAFAA